LRRGPVEVEARLNELIAAHQFMGLLNEFSLWPWMTGRGRIPASDDHIVEETVRMFLQHHGHARSKKHGRAVQRGA
jgi:TetR/AcrR family transcriptional regulator of autoinduction and epiphytic fitness